jgi:Flp pilus assembly protein TadD
VALARVLAARGATNEAVDVVTPLTTSRPGDARPVEQLAALFADLEEIDRLKPLAEQLQRQWPDRPATP